MRAAHVRAYLSLIPYRSTKDNRYAYSMNDLSSSEVESGCGQFPLVPNPISQMMIGRNSSGSDDRLNHPISILLLFLSITTITTAFSLRSSNTELLSNLQTIQAELLISIGRVPGTAMPPEWAASGAKLGFTLEVEFTKNRLSTK